MARESDRKTVIQPFHLRITVQARQQFQNRKEVTSKGRQFAGIWFSPAEGINFLSLKEASHEFSEKSKGDTVSACDRIAAGFCDSVGIDD
jgi:hypothetical protein